MADWKNAINTQEGFWIKAVRYVSENETSNAELELALIKYREVVESTAKNEAAKILKASRIVKYSSLF